MQNAITVKTDISASVQKVWQFFTQPNHVMQWNHASADWHCPAATIDLQVGGKFVYTMAAKDGSFSFNFSGTYNDVLTEELLMITLDDNRKMNVTFSSIGDVTEVVETFEPETENSIELQQTGWQNILDNFREYVERN
jgi:uncharacterized protein YndB with AHSA1/START domain